MCLISVSRNWEKKIHIYHPDYQWNWGLSETRGLSELRAVVFTHSSCCLQKDQTSSLKLAPSSWAPPKIQALSEGWDQMPQWQKQSLSHMPSRTAVDWGDVKHSCCYSAFLLGPPLRAALPGQRRLPRQWDGPGEPLLSGDAICRTWASLWNMTPQLPSSCSFISTVSKL